MPDPIPQQAQIVHHVPGSLTLSALADLPADQAPGYDRRDLTMTTVCVWLAADGEVHTTTENGDFTDAELDRLLGRHGEHGDTLIHRVVGEVDHAYGRRSAWVGGLQR